MLFIRNADSPEGLRFAPKQPSTAIYERAHAKVEIKAPSVFRRLADENDEDK
jgi:hypothetical protein